MKGFLANCEIVAFSLTPDNSAVGFRIRNNCRGKKMKKKISVISCLSLWRLLYQSESRSVMSNSFRPHGLYSPWNSSRQITGVGSCSLLQGIFLTHGSNSGLPHCRRILYQLSHCRWILYQLSYQGSPMRWQESSLPAEPHGAGGKESACQCRM